MGRNPDNSMTHGGANMTSDSASATPTLRRKLGRGLGSLLSTPVHVEAPPPAVGSAQSALQREPQRSAAMVLPPSLSPCGLAADASSLQMLGLGEIRPNPKQ